MSPFVRRASVRHADRLIARSVLFLTLAVYTATFGGMPDSTDGEIEFQTTSALARRGSLALGGTVESDLILEWVGSHPEGAPVRPGVGARADGNYAWFGVGQAAAALPLYAAGHLVGQVLGGLQEAHRSGDYYGRPSSEYFKHVIVGYRNPLLSALTAWLLVLVVRRLGTPRRLAWLAGLSYGLTTFAWPQARSSLSDVQGTFLLFLAFHLILRIREHFERLERPSDWELVGVGAALALTFLTRVALFPAALVLAAAAEVVLWRGHSRLSASRWTPAGPARVGGRRSMLLVIGPLVVGLAIFLGTNQWRFGNPLDSGYGEVTGGLFGASMPMGVAGLLFSPGRGLLWMAPLLVLAPLGLWRLRADGERMTGRVLAALALAVVLPVAGMQGWHGAWTYGPRYLLPLLPFLWVAVAASLSWAEDAVLGRVLAVGLVGLGLMVQLPAVLVDHNAHQDLAVQAARVEWPDELLSEEAARTGGTGELSPRDLEELRFERIQWDWRFAAPWAHWRILRHRTAGFEGDYPVREIFHVDDDKLLNLSHPRDEGFRHLAWVDMVERLGGPRWPGVLLVLALAIAGMVLSQRGLDRAAP